MTTYWCIDENDVYVRVFQTVFAELDTGFFQKEIVDNYLGLHLESQYIVTRLYFRTIRWIPLTDLEKYLPPETLQDRIKELIDTKWLQVPTVPEEALNAISTKDLVTFAQSFGIKTTKTGAVKSELLSRCAVKAHFGQRPLGARVMDKFNSLFSFYKLTHLVEELQKAMFLYLLPSFGATRDLIVRKNMRLVYFMDYNYYTQREMPLFSTKEDFESFYAARLILDPIEEATKVDENTLLSVETAPRSGSGRYSSAYALGRAVHLCARLLGKQGNFHREYQWTQNYLAQTVHKGKRGENWIRMLLLELKFFKEQNDTVWLRRALNTYYDALCEVDEVSRLDLDKKVAKLTSLLKKNGIEAPEFCTTEKIQIPLREEYAELKKSTASRTSWGKESFTVEETALQIYAADGWEGGHYENSIINTVFTLCFQDIFFAQKKEFRNCVQTAPMSMARVLEDCKEELQSRLQEDLCERLTTTYNEYHEDKPMIAGVNWDIPLECLQTVIRQEGTKTLLKRLLEHNRLSGFADLTLWNEDRCKFVEVKSTNDVLSDKQYVWIKHMLDAGLDVEICKVRDFSKRKDCKEENSNH